jgi:hypothetical protein
MSSEKELVRLATALEKKKSEGKIAHLILLAPARPVLHQVRAHRLVAPLGRQVQRCVPPPRAPHIHVRAWTHRREAVR